MSEMTTQQIADYLGIAVGTVRAKALKLFRREEIVYDLEKKGFVFTAEQAETLAKSFEETEKKPLLLGTDKPLSVNEEQTLESTIKVSDENGIQTVSARDLHERLESNERFSKWWERFTKYGFEENTDFTVCTKKYAANQHGGEKEFTDYAISIEMAKQICMLQRTEKGKQYRDYFIRLEKAWNTPEAVMARALQVANKTLDDARRQIAELKPDADSWNTYAGNLEQRNLEKCFRDVAKMLQVAPQYVLIDFLIKKKYIYRDSVTKRIKPTQAGIEAGIVVSRAVNNDSYSGEQCKITPHGMKKLAEWKEKGVFEGHIVAERK